MRQPIHASYLFVYENRIHSFCFIKNNILLLLLLIFSYFIECEPDFFFQLRTCKEYANYASFQAFSANLLAIFETICLCFFIWQGSGGKVILILEYVQYPATVFQLDVVKAFIVFIRASFTSIISAVLMSQC